MGCNRCWHIIYVIISLFLISFLSVYGSKIYDPKSLDALIHDYAMEEQAQKRTGNLFKVSLPANFSGMEVSVVRLRSSNFWERGANLSSLYIPPRVIPFPFVKRLAIIYQNLGNWSSHYYKVPGYSLVAPVIGFVAYDDSNISALGNKTLKFIFTGDPILVRFPHIVTKENSVLRCVKLGQDGLVQFRNITKGNTCITGGDGHFSVAVPIPGVKKQRHIWKWWAVGFVAGFIGLVLLGIIGFSIFKLVRGKRIREMVGESENGVVFETTWIGRSKMPSASMVRTQPALELESVP